MQQLILIVEDEQPIVDILKFNLEKNDYRVIEALDGNEGLRLALSKNPDLVLLDVMLPGLDGFGVCRKIYCSRGPLGCIRSFVHYRI